MLKRLLAAIALTSLILLCVLLVYWWRSYHGYADHFTLGSGSATESHFYPENGRIRVEIINRLPGTITSTARWYRFRDVLGYFLIVPCLWVAVKVRSYLPRPPGRGAVSRR